MILEKYTWGSLGPVHPIWAVYASDDDGVGSDIGLLTNPSSTQPAYAVLVSSIRGVGPGNTTCKLKVKEYLNILDFEIFFQWGGVLFEADLDVAFATPSNPVKSSLKFPLNVTKNIGWQRFFFHNPC